MDQYHASSYAFFSTDLVIPMAFSTCPGLACGCLGLVVVCLNSHDSANCLNFRLEN